MTAFQKLQKKNNENKFICVGLDTDRKKIPPHLKAENNPVLEFNKQIIETCSDHAAAFKINFAFYEKDGSAGFENLEKTIELIPEDILIIGDAKRGDIGNTSQMYAKAIFEYFGCDAATIHPYMGEDSVKPFLEDESKLNFILALTSNPGAIDFEKLKLENGFYLFQHVIKKVNEWNEKNNCGIVFGATKIEELIENLDIIGSLPVLLPGVGAQGGSLEDVVKNFLNKKRKNYLINVSRGIIYKSGKEDFAEAAAAETSILNDTIRNLINS
jgi:orotidine-5'-phosphate decarboxylase